jgi:hypothetical protein
LMPSLMPCLGCSSDWSPICWKHTFNWKYHNMTHQVSWLLHVQSLISLICQMMSMQWRRTCISILASVSKLKPTCASAKTYS